MCFVVIVRNARTITTLSGDEACKNDGRHETSADANDADPVAFLCGVGSLLQTWAPTA